MSDDFQRSLQQYFDHRAFTDGMSRAMRIADQLQEAFISAALDKRVSAVSYDQQEENNVGIIVLQRDGENIDEKEVQTAVQGFFSERGYNLSGVSLISGREAFAEAVSNQKDGSLSFYFEPGFGRWLYEREKQHTP